MKIRKETLLVHIPHASLYVPSEYAKASLIPPESLDEENLFMCDYMVDRLVPPILESCVVKFGYSRLYCDVERFRDGSEIMERYGMGYMYTKTSRGLPMFVPDEAHRREVDKIYDAHHEVLDKRVSEILAQYGECLIIDLHSFSDETVKRLFGYENCPDVCIGTEPDYYDAQVVKTICEILDALDLSYEFNFPYKGSILPNKYYGKSDTGIVSIMIEINKRVYLEKVKR